MSQTKDNDLSGIDKYEGSFDQDEIGVTCIPTATIRALNDFTLLALFTFLASCPKNWRLNAKHLANHFECNKDKIYKAIERLIELKFLTRTVIRDKGKFVRYHYRLHLRQTVPDTPFPEKPETVKPEPANPDAYITKKEENKEYITATASKAYFFEHYKKMEREQLQKTHEEMDLEQKKEKFKQEALEDEECITIFKKRFANSEVTLEKLYKDCCDYWSQKNQLVYKSRFLTHLIKCPINNYPEKESVDTVIKQKPNKEEIELNIEYGLYVTRIKGDIDINLIPANTPIMSRDEWVKKCTG